MVQSTSASQAARMKLSPSTWFTLMMNLMMAKLRRGQRPLHQRGWSGKPSRSQLIFLLRRLTSSKLTNHRPLDFHDEYRHPSANKDGGFANHDPDDVAKLRSTGKEYLKQIGKQIMSGKFNLFKISAPIKCMGAWSMINAIGTMACTAPFYMTRSALVVDPLERMKCLIAG